MTFERAGRADAEEILKLYKSLVGTEYCAWTDSYPEREEIAGDLARDALFCMKDEGKIVAVISMDADEAVEALPCWTEKCIPSVELSRVGVRKEYQNRGIAGEMIRCAAEEARKQGYRGIHMIVSKQNVKAQKAYNKLAFAVVGETRLYDVDWWCYEKQIAE